MKQSGGDELEPNRAELKQLEAGLTKILQIEKLLHLGSSRY